MPQNPGFTFWLDTPQTQAGTITVGVGDDLVVAGWLLCAAPVARAFAIVNGAVPVEIGHGLSRPDVGAAFAGQGFHAASASGFRCRIAPPAPGSPIESVEFVALVGSDIHRLASYRVEVARGDAALASLDGWPAYRALHPEASRVAATRPFLIVLRHDASAPGPSPDARRRTIDSLAAQSHDNWRLLVADDPLRQESGFRGAGPLGPDRFVPSGDALPGLVRREPDLWITTLRDGDGLAPDALACVAAHIAANPGVSFISTDERIVDGAARTVQDYRRPDWSPETLLAANYLGRSWFVRAGALPASLAQGGGLLDASDHGAALACAFEAGDPEHLPLRLRQGPALSGTDAADAAAVERLLHRRGAGAIVAPGRCAGTLRVRPARAHEPLVSIVIPTCGAGGHIAKLLQTLRARTRHRAVEIICIDNAPALDPGLRHIIFERSDIAIQIDEPFNWSRFNNVAAAEASGEVLLFLNDDIEIVDDDWLTALVDETRSDDIGLVGPQLLYRDGTVQHAGMYMSAAGTFGHAFRGYAAEAGGYFDLALTRRNVLALTGACMMIGTGLFVDLGGFEERHAVVYNDVDLCLRALRRGRRNVYTPFSRLVHVEAASRGDLPETYDDGQFARDWHDLLAGTDPYLNPGLADVSDPYRSPSALKRRTR